MWYNDWVESARSLPAARNMDARQAVLLTPLESALTGCLPSYKQIAPITPLESALTDPFQLIENTATLTPAESALTDIPSVTSLDSALTKNWGGGREGTLCPIRHYPFSIHHSEIWRSPLATRHSPLPLKRSVPIFAISAGAVRTLRPPWQAPSAPSPSCIPRRPR
jgi:hypothetical protein